MHTPTSGFADLSILRIEYHPSLLEILTGSAIIAYGLTAFSLGVKSLRVVDHSLIEKEHKTADVNSTETVPA
ncbi:MAG TPA: hypothetical protein VF918_23805 [Anaerolineales bacterium]